MPKGVKRLKTASTRSEQKKNGIPASKGSLRYAQNATHTLRFSVSLRSTLVPCLITFPTKTQERKSYKKKEYIAYYVCLFSSLTLLRTCKVILLNHIFIYYIFIFTIYSKLYYNLNL